VSAFHSAWLITVAAGLATTLVLARLGPPARAHVESLRAAEPATVAEPVLAEALVAESTR
jgi:hypothetical protein